MNYVILDLEWNGTYSRRKKKYFNEIIDIGAVKLDENLNIIGKYSMLITTQIGKKLNKYVEDLTHISFDELESAHHTFTHALSKFNEFAADGVILTWGITDILTMMSNCEYFLQYDRPEFLKYYINLQSYCQSKLEVSNNGNQLGLSAVAEMLGIEYNADEMHRALADSELSAKCFQALFDKKRVECFMRKADDEFYRRLTFKNHYITDINSPLINRKEFYAVCDQCGARMLVKSKWKSKNRGFRARVVCPRCKIPCQATVRFKHKFDSVEIKRFVSPIPIKTDGQDATEESNKAE